MTLDFMVAQAVFRARQIERAANDPGPWTISYAGHIVPAVRWVGEDRVIFRSHFPNACWIEPDDVVMTLHCRGEMVGSRLVDATEAPSGEFVTEWTFALAEPVSA